MKEPNEGQLDFQAGPGAASGPLPAPSADVRTGKQGSWRKVGRGLGRTLAAVCAATWASAPVLIPTGLCAQFAVLGLRPIWLEERRLEERRLELEERTAALVAERELLLCEARMLSDPIYRERVRRSRLERGSQPLLLGAALDPALRER